MLLYEEVMKYDVGTYGIGHVVEARHKVLSMLAGVTISGPALKTLYYFPAVSKFVATN